MAARDQYPHHTSDGVIAPPMPCPAAEDARPTLGSVSSASAVEADRGHAISAISPYRNTEPGAPVRADADPVKISPRPSPKNQTPNAQKNDTARAGRTIRRNSNPNPIAT